MGGAVYGLIAMIAVVLLAGRFGYEWREATRKLRVSAAFFVIAVILQGAAIVTTEGDPAIIGCGFAGVGWFLLLLSVFDIADPDEAPQAD